MKKLVLLQHFIVSVLVTILAACIFQTQMVLASLSDLDIDVMLSDRVYMTWQDLLGLLPSYGIIICIGLALGFGIAKLLRHYTSLQSFGLYALAGATVMAVILLAMQPVLGVTLLAGARSVMGILLQILAGLLGGICFMYFRKKNNRRLHSGN